MSTRSGIGFKDKSGKITGIYCHLDGYPSYVGRMLSEHYSKVTKVKSLMKLGDLSFLDKNIGVKHDFDDYRFFETHKQCRAYKRDRGEEYHQAKLFNSIADFIEHFDDRGAEYYYIYSETSGTWKNISIISRPQVMEIWEAIKLEKGQYLNENELDSLI